MVSASVEIQLCCLRYTSIQEMNLPGLSLVSSGESEIKMF